MTYANNENRCKYTMQYLVDMGVPKRNIFCAFGYDKNKDTEVNMGEIIPDDAVCHMGFAHYWLYRCSGILEERTWSLVFYIEDDVRLTRELQEIMSFVIAAKTPLVWVGYDKKPRITAQQRCRQLGSKMIAFKGNGLQLWIVDFSQPRCDLFK